MNKRNYQNEFEQLVSSWKEDKKTLLLHCCCAPCSSYVLEYLQQYFAITVFFYNPNITEEIEYNKRKKELKRYISEVEFGNQIQYLDADYDASSFLKVAKGYENELEKGKRCKRCFQLRLEETAKKASEGMYDFFCTTLSISPHKNADMLMEIGEKVGKQYGVSYLPSDFKKKNGYKRSIELSKQHNLYRQNYCGCVFSKEARRKETHNE